MNITYRSQECTKKQTLCSTVSIQAIKVGIKNAPKINESLQILWFDIYFSKDYKST